MKKKILVKNQRNVGISAKQKRRRNLQLNTYLMDLEEKYKTLQASHDRLVKALRGDALDEAIKELSEDSPDLERIKSLLVYKKHLADQALESAEKIK